MLNTNIPTLLIDLEATAIRCTIMDSNPPIFIIMNFLERVEDEFLLPFMIDSLQRMELEPQQINVMLSVAAPVAGDRVKMARPENLEFSRSEIMTGLMTAGWKVARFELVNDMFACSLALAGADKRLIRTISAEGSLAREGFPILFVYIRPHLGAAGLIPLPYQPDRQIAPAPIWIPVMSEAGGMSLAPLKNWSIDPEFGERLSRLAQDLPLMEQGLMTAYDFLSPMAIESAQKLLSMSSGAVLPVREMAEQPSGSTAAHVMEAWSFMCGMWSRSLALAFGARGGVYLAGETPKAFLSSETCGEVNRNKFMLGFQLGGPIDGYLQSVQINLISEDDLVMGGLRRLGQDQLS